MSKGHNFYGGFSAEHLKQFVERIERLEEEKKNIAEDMREVFAEAKGTGFDVPTMRKILKLRKIDANDREEQEYLLETYRRALGMGFQEDLFDRQEEERADPEIFFSSSETGVKFTAVNEKKADEEMVKKPEKAIFDATKFKDQIDEQIVYNFAVDAVKESQKATTSYVQRICKIGYNRAAQIIDRMEKEGIISAADPVGRREVLAA